MAVFFRWATIPLMYLLMSQFSDTGTAYIALSIANLFVGINTTAITFFLDLPVFREYEVRTKCNGFISCVKQEKRPFVCMPI